ncbi:hypothetical protein GCM10011511_25500 [Puia dinghuensis]|uniref:DUF3592 domain-containing protein n=1 Tax=Puia dinghuensis TaxID=1792502 RepID=A0A8J2UDF3_9BACT|nr:hypothetical protein GCM10011511_25500 [Puia dinghuensis]
MTNRLYSPDSSYVALIYYIDNGAMGNSRSMANVLMVGDTLGSLNKGKLPCKDLPHNSCYFPDHWINSKTLQVTLEEISFVKAGLPFDSTAIKVNGIDCKVVPYDNSYERAPLIKHLSFSDDRKKILIVYQYTGDLNISAIKYGDKLPKYGNLVTIPAGNVDPIQYATWHGDDIGLYMKDARMYEPSDYINKGVAYKVDLADIGQTKIPSESVLYADPRIDNLLKEEGVSTKGVITESIWNMRDNKSAFNYEYEYRVAGQRFRSGFRIFRDFKAGAQYKEGDSVEVLYDPKEPLIHTDKISR